MLIRKCFFLFSQPTYYILFFGVTVSSSSSIICLPLQHAMTEDWDCDPNGKQLDGEYLNINPGEKDYYSLVSLELWPPMTCPRGKTVPNSMTSVGLCPKNDPSQGTPASDWSMSKVPLISLVGLGNSSGSILFSRYGQGHDWCLLCRKLSCRSQIENNINRFIFGLFCLRVNISEQKTPK